jgi:hypothetical protein
LPHPDGPRSTVKLPRSAEREKSEKTGRLSKLLEKDLISSIKNSRLEMPGAEVFMHLLQQNTHFPSPA